MNDTNSLAHTKWNCKYHIVFIPKYRRKLFYGEMRKEIGKILRELCSWKQVNIIEAEACPDHIHMLVEIPPKMTVCMTIKSGAYNAAATFAELSQMLGEPAEQITSGEYKRLTTEYENLVVPVPDERRAVNEYKEHDESAKDFKRSIFSLSVNGFASAGIWNF